jgi:ParB-like chromosome segregation protein Spo0J
MLVISRRAHSEAQVAEIAGSILTFGSTDPIPASEQGDIIAGHGRLAAARLLGLTEVPVIRRPSTGARGQPDRALNAARSSLSRKIVARANRISGRRSASSPRARPATGKRN